MATNDFLEAETRERPRVAIVAALAALLTLAAAIVGVLVLQDEPDNLPASLLYRNSHQAGLAISAVCSLLGSIGIAYVLDFMFRATRNRSEAAIQPWVRPLPWIGGIGLAVVGIVIQVVLATKLSHFANDSTQTYEEARKLLTSSDYSIPRYLGIIPQLALAFGLIMISLGAMRVGLLTRFMGYLGVIAAALFVLPLVPLPIVQIFWLGALAALIWGGLRQVREPPAWRLGEAVPWPSAAEVREQRVRAAEARRGGTPSSEQEPATIDAVSDEEDGDQPDSGGPSAATSRRKRKKRR